MTTEWAIKAQPFVAYDGTNSAEIRDALDTYRGGAVSVEFEGPESVTLEVLMDGMAPDSYTLARGDRLSLLTGDVITPAEWSEQYLEAP